MVANTGGHKFTFTLRTFYSKFCVHMKIFGMISH